MATKYGNVNDTHGMHTQEYSPTTTSFSETMPDSLDVDSPRRARNKSTSVTSKAGNVSVRRYYFHPTYRAQKSHPVTLVCFSLISFFLEGYGEERSYWIAVLTDLSETALKGVRCCLPGSPTT